MLLSVFHYLWPDSNNQEKDIFNQVSEVAKEATKREKRTVVNSTFFGDKIGSVSGGDKQYDKLFKQYDEELNDIYKFGSQ